MSLIRASATFGTWGFPTEVCVIGSFSNDEQTGNYCRRIGVGLGVREELSVSLAMKITNSDGCRVCEVIDREETLVATACNHPNCLVLPFSLELIRLAA